jgi:hypothetical protein
MKKIVIQSHFGIGDLLFMTPSLEVIKDAYPKCHITVNTSRPSLLNNNPYIDKIGTKREGVMLMYTAPDTGRLPEEHNIVEDWKIITNHYNLTTSTPCCVPQIYLDKFPTATSKIGVQVLHKRIYHNKRVWPYYERLAMLEGFEPIPQVKNVDELVQKILSYKAVVCNEGGISHIAAALGTPAVVLFGGFTRPEWTGYDFHINLTVYEDCSPCYNNSPCRNNFKCWDKISMKEVERLARELL